MEQETIQKIKNSFMFLPKEVKSFLYQGPFDKSIDNINKKFNLNEKQALFVRSATIAYILDSLDEDNIEEMFEQTELAPEVLEGVKDEIYQSIIKNILEYIDIPEEENGEEVATTTINNTSSVSPAQALASIKERLSSPSIVVPITRDHSFTKSEGEVSKTIEAPKIDPYRELPSE